jgi:hypothetical protein
LIENFCRHTIQFRKVRIQHDSMATDDKDRLLNLFARYRALMLPPCDVRQCMKLHGDTVFIPKNQEMKFVNGCIINWLEMEVKVNGEVM